MAFIRPTEEGKNELVHDGKNLVTRDTRELCLEWAGDIHLVVDKEAPEAEVVGEPVAPESVV